MKSRRGGCFCLGHCSCRNARGVAEGKLEVDSSPAFPRFSCMTFWLRTFVVTSRFPIPATLRMVFSQQIGVEERYWIGFSPENSPEEMLREQGT